MTLSVNAAAKPAAYASFFARTRRQEVSSFRDNPSALLLSGGGNLTFFHVGVIKVLLGAGLLPRVLSGTSAGSVIAALLCTRRDRELHVLHEDEIAFLGFTEKEPSHRHTAATLEDELAAVLPDVTFAEAAEITGRSLNISLAHPGGGGILCGPRETPNVLVRDAVRASCAVPFVFEPVIVRERRHGHVTPFRSGQGWVDGSLYADVPVKAIKQRYGVSHALVSLVNPAVRPFLSDGPQAGAAHHLRSFFLTATKSAALGCAQMARMTAGRGRAGHVLDTVCRVMEQTYDGDLVLTPSRRFFMSELLDHPSKDLVMRMIADGEARTRTRLADVRALGSIAGNAARPTVGRLQFAA